MRSVHTILRSSSFAAVTLAMAGAFSHQTPPAPYDVLVRNARILDGSGNPWMAGDIGIRGDRIVAVGRLASQAAVRVLDAKGLVAAPGFIDVHSHAGPGLADRLNAAEPLLAQGITTAVVNPDGGGEVDIARQRSQYERRGIGVNVAMFAPHGSIRQQVMGMADRAPSPAELEQMVSLVKAGMQAGAIGLSTGLWYAPGSYAKTEEVIALARPAAKGGGVYSSHIRDEGDANVGVLAAVDEVVRIAEEARLPGVVSHMKALGRASWGLSLAMTMRIDAARERGVEVFADQYPYDASGTSIVGALVPRWAEVGGWTELQRRLTGSERSRLTGEIRANILRRGGPTALLVSRYAADPTIEGKSLAELAVVRGKAPEEVALDLLAREDAGLVSFSMSDRDIVQIMKQPYTMTCTDGDLVPFGEGKPHPRAYGSFARKLRVYVRERGVLDWPAAIRSMTSLPALVFGMKDRGVIRPGAFADLLVFDPDEIGDNATYQNPHQLSQGIEHIVINGRIVREDGKFSGKLAGTIVTPERQ